jgi:RNA polymerase sigma-70 factor (ECF subfamily)
MCLVRVSRASGVDEPRDIDTRLMIAFARGDDSAFEKLVHRNARRMAALAARYLGDPAEAEDVVQEAFIRVYRARRRYRPKARFTTWLYRIVANEALNRRRSRPMPTLSALAPEDGPGLEPADDSPGPPAQLEILDERATILDALSKLPDAQRMAVVLNIYQGLSYREVGEVMGLKMGAVKSLLFRARANLGKWLAP